jgi:hypothetical protein
LQFTSSVVVPSFRFLFVVSLTVSVPLHLFHLAMIDAYASIETRRATATIERINRELPVTIDRTYAAADAMDRQLQADIQAIH